MYENEKGCSESQVPSLADFGQRLRGTTNVIGDYVIEIESKLQTIKRINNVVEKSDVNLKEAQPECVMDELNQMLYRLNGYKSRLENCLSHLNQII